ncbi:hypothetical protein BH09BAC5_BH09BAC5_16170 [soil metagenome]
MKKTLISIVLFPAFAFAQNNLVPNPGFESYKRIPTQCMQGNMADILNNWDAANDGTSDYITDLAMAGSYPDCKSDNGQGIQTPHNGHGMAFLYNYYPDSRDYREYVAVTLTTPLIPGKKYYAEMYVSLTAHSGFASNNIGMSFFTGTLEKQSGYVLTSSPQINSTEIITDSKGWTKISGSFIADKAYTYMIIGNFFTGANTKFQAVPPQNMGLNGTAQSAGYYLDDVVVKATESNLAVSGDTLVMPNAWAKLNATGSKSYSWAEYSKPKVIIGNAAEIKVQVKTKKTFIVYGDNGESEIITVNVTKGPVFMQTLNDRKVKKGSTVKIHNEKIKITVYDNNKIDGDIISLYYGDSCIVSNLELSKRKKSFTITIDKTNPRQLILFANNLGSMPPNTAACVIGAGKKQINVVLSSDLKASDAVMLVYEEER